MFISAHRAMHRRQMIESPSGLVPVMQMPDLTRLGRFTGPPIVTLGDTQVFSGLPVQTSAGSTSSGFSFSPWLLGAGVVLLVGALWWRSRSAGAGGGILAAVKPRRRRTKKIPVLQAALYTIGAGAGAYYLGKHLQ